MERIICEDCQYWSEREVENGGDYWVVYTCNHVQCFKRSDNELEMIPFNDDLEENKCNYFTDKKAD